MLGLAAGLALAVSGAGQAPLERLPSGRAGDVVRRAIEYAGGMEAWAAVRTLSFRKTTIRFRADGSEESRRVEFHRYRMSPFRALIERTEGGKSIVLVNDGRQARKLVDGVSLSATDDSNQARNATFGSHYVFNMPFKLTDAGVHLEHVGRETLRGGTLAVKIRVTYDKGAGDAGGLHTWTYFFDTKTGRLAANLLRYDEDRYEYTEYLDDVSVGPLRLSMRRYGYAAGARGARGPRQSAIVYEDVRLDVPWEDGMSLAPSPAPGPAGHGSLLPGEPETWAAARSGLR